MMDGYFTEGNDVLENKLGITDPVGFQKVESEIVSVRNVDLLENPPEGTMDYAYLRQIHYRLFSDIYEFAGKTRDVDIAKGGSVFCYKQHIEVEQKRYSLGLILHLNSNCRKKNTCGS